MNSPFTQYVDYVEHSLACHVTLRRRILSMLRDGPKRREHFAPFATSDGELDRILRDLVNGRLIRMIGKTRAATYELPPIPPDSL